MALAACSSAHAAQFVPMVGGADFSQPLQTNVGYTIAINLNPVRYDYTFYSGRKTNSCNRTFSNSPAYCPTQVLVKPSDSSLLSATLDGDDASAVTTLVGNVLYIPLAAERDVTNVFSFTQRFTETRTGTQYRTSSNPGLDGARTDLNLYSKFVPPPSQTGPLRCSYAVGNDVLVTTATCDLTVSFASPVPQPTSGGAVPEPATWALLIGGFAFVGAAMRRQRGIARPRLA